MTKIHGESHPISMRILVMYLMTQYFHVNFHVNALLVKLPNGSFPELCIYFTFSRITFHLHYICITFALHLHFA